MLFLDIRRPLRPQADLANRVLIAAVQRSPFIRAARAQHVAREKQFAVAWDAIIGDPAPSAETIEQ